MINHYDPSQPLHDLEGWIVFYSQQAQRIEDDPELQDVFQAACETGVLLIELKRLRETHAKP